MNKPSYELEGVESVTFTDPEQAKEWCKKRREWRKNNPEAPYSRMDLVALLWKRD